MFGIVLAMLNTSACSRLPSAAASSAAADEAAEPRDDRAGGHHRAGGRATRSVARRSAHECGPPPRGVARGPAGTAGPRSPRTAARRRPPMISQITLLTWAARSGKRVLAAERGARRSSVDDQRRPRGRRARELRASSSTVARSSGAELDRRRTAVISSGGSVAAWTRTVTGWSRSLVTVAENGPVSLDRVTDGGCLDGHLVRAARRSSGGRPLRGQARGRGRVARRRRTRRSAPRRRPVAPTVSLAGRSVSAAVRRRRSGRAPAAKLAPGSSRRAWRARVGRRPRSTGSRAPAVDAAQRGQVQPVDVEAVEELGRGRGASPGPSRRERRRPAVAVAGRAAAAAASLSIRCRSASGLSRSSGPGPPADARRGGASTRRPSDLGATGGSPTANISVGDQDGRDPVGDAGRARRRRGSRSARPTTGAAVQPEHVELAARAARAGHADEPGVGVGRAGDVDVAVRQGQDLVARASPDGSAPASSPADPAPHCARRARPARARRPPEPGGRRRSPARWRSATRTPAGLSPSLGRSVEAERARAGCRRPAGRRRRGRPGRPAR